SLKRNKYSSTETITLFLFDPARSEALRKLLLIFRYAKNCGSLIFGRKKILDFKKESYRLVVPHFGAPTTKKSGTLTSLLLYSICILLQSLLKKNRIDFQFLVYNIRAGN